MGVLYWAIVSLVLGGCIGSFLNVVIYRWPRDLSVRKPARSFCPLCEASIAWYDNIPVLSYLLLRGRCRHCQAPISLQYPLVELATALVFVVTYDAFFVARQRVGIGDLGVDWPMLIAHWGLWAGMIALSVMDLEAYMVDIRLTWVVAGIGVVGHLLWTPASSAPWIRPGIEQAAFAVAVTLGLAISTVWLLHRRSRSDERDAEIEDDVPEVQPEADISPVTSPGFRLGWLLLLGPILLIIVYVGFLVSAGDHPALDYRPVPRLMMVAEPEEQSMLDEGTVRLGAGLIVIFLGLALAASCPQPEADDDIVEAIHEEACDARRNALRELGFLAPALILAAVSLVLFASMRPERPTGLGGLLNWSPIGQWRPILGLSTALAGWVIGGAVGWVARIGFTLVFGKEALGMGDVHILAAAGAIAGWPVAFVGFFLAAPLTLLAIVVIHLRRQSRALPYGPWLALAFFVACVFQDRVLFHLNVRWLFDGS